MDTQVTVERDVRSGAWVVRLHQQVCDIPVRSGPLVEDHRAGMVGMVVVVDAA
jgi:hypothetical protein